MSYDRGGDGLDPAVHGRRQPGSPASLRATRYDEPGYWNAQLGLHELLDGIHRADRALDHWEEQRPCGVTGLHVPGERLGDQRVFSESAKQRLVRDVVQDGDGGAYPTGYGRPIEQGVSAAGVARHDEKHECGPALDSVGCDDEKGVAPRRIPPLLRGKSQAVCGAAAGEGAPGYLLPRVSAVVLTHVPVQLRGRLSSASQESPQGHDQG